MVHRRKAPWIAADLQALGAADREGASLHDLPDLRTLPARLGAGYVLEGATLGGQVIRRRLRAALGPLVEPALRFYTG